jgi:hypothetical protein
MPSNPDEIVQQMQQDFQALVTDMTGADTRAQNA